MPHGLITSAGKAAIAVAGLAWGASRSFLVPESSRNGATSASRFGSSDMEARLSRMEAALERLCAQTRRATRTTPQTEPEAPLAAAAPTSARQSSKDEDYVTRKDFTEALDRLEKRFANKVGEKISSQMLAIGSLRAMICDTDALLTRVLDRLESLSEYDAAENSDEA